MNFKAMAAIAATLIVCVPLALGYGLAIDEEETTALESTKSWGISDMMLNSSTPYYGQYLGASNNDLLLNGSKLVQVGYNKMSSTATSYPTKSTGSGTLPLSSPSETTYPMTPVQENGKISIDSTSKVLQTTNYHADVNSKNSQGTHTATSSTVLTYDSTSSGSPDALQITIDGSYPMTISYTDNMGSKKNLVSETDGVHYCTMTFARANSYGMWSFYGSFGGQYTADDYVKKITVEFTGASTYGIKEAYFSSIFSLTGSWSDASWSSTLWGTLRYTRSGSSGYIYAAEPKLTHFSFDPETNTLTIGSYSVVVTSLDIASVNPATDFEYVSDVRYTSSYYGRDTSGAVSYSLSNNAKASVQLKFNSFTQTKTHTAGESFYMVCSGPTYTQWTYVSGTTTISNVTEWVVTVGSTDGYRAYMNTARTEMSQIPDEFAAEWSDVVIRYGNSYEVITEDTTIGWYGQTLYIGDDTHNNVSSVYVATFDGGDLTAVFEASTVGTLSGQVSDADAYQVIARMSSWTLTMNDGLSDTTKSYDASAYLSIVRTSSSAFVIFIGGNTPSVVSYGVVSWSITAGSSGSLVVGSSSYSEISSDADTWSFSAAGSVRITKSDGSAAYAGNLGNTAVTVTGSSVIAGGTTYTGVQKIEFAQVSGSSLPYTYERTSSTGYGDPSEGWTIPSTGSVWFNGQTNESVTFIVSMPLDSTCGLSTGTDTPETVHLQRNASGRITIWDSAGKGTVLGSYGVAMIEVGTDEITVTGLAEWPAMGSSPTRFNTISYQNNGESFEYVKLRGTAVTWRVDSAQALAGTFPSTKDYTVDLAAKFPTVTQSVIQINSVGVYGSSLTVAGRTYDLENGSITVQDLDAGKQKTITIRGMVVMSVDSTHSATQKYDVYVNNIRIGTSNASGGSLTFGGEWSLTATLSQMEPVTHTAMKWQPGEFALDETGIVAAGLLTAVGAFVVLGMTGRASGPKAALLAVVCGGAAMIMLILI